MKSLITLLCLIALSNAGFAQNVYHPIPLDSTEWRIDEYFHGPGNCIQTGPCGVSRYWTTTKKVTIDSFKYSLVYWEVKDTYTNGNSTYGYSVIAGVRNDSINKRLYLRFTDAWGQPITSYEQLFYDFNLKPGDTMPPMYVNGYHKGLIVNSMDSVLINNEYHKVYNYISNKGFLAKIIEGIGTSVGFMNEYFTEFSNDSLGRQTLVCVKSFGKTIYLDTTYSPASSCEINIATTVNSLNPISVKATLYPNPANEYLTVSNGQLTESSCIIMIYNLLGQEVKQYRVNVKNNNPLNLDISALPAGYYCLTLFNGKEWVNQPFVKN